MSDVVFVLGAGASKEAGGPLLTDFLDAARVLIQTGNVAEDAKIHFDRVMRIVGSLQSIHSKSTFDLRSIESIYTILEMGKLVGRFPLSREFSIEEGIQSLRRVIVETLERSILFSKNRLGRLIPGRAYERFAEIILAFRENFNPRRNVTVITFNYDVCMEVALISKRIDYTYQLDNESNSRALKLLKLHGSMSWAKDANGGNVLPVDVMDFLDWSEAVKKIPNYENTYRVQIGSMLGEYFRSKRILVDNDPLIIPPSWNKSDYHATVSSVWSSAAKELSRAEQIYVIGYSLPKTDQFFRLLYALGTQGDVPITRFSVIDPDKSAGKKFRSMLGPGAKDRFDHFDKKFSDGIAEFREHYGFPR